MLLTCQWLQLPCQPAGSFFHSRHSLRCHRGCRICTLCTATGRSSLPASCCLWTVDRWGDLGMGRRGGDRLFTGVEIFSWNNMYFIPEWDRWLASPLPYTPSPHQPPRQLLSLFGSSFWFISLLHVLSVVQNRRTLLLHVMMNFLNRCWQSVFEHGWTSMHTELHKLTKKNIKGLWSFPPCSHIL